MGATAYSINETANVNGAEPHNYLFERLPHLKTVDGHEAYALSGEFARASPPVIAVS